MSRTTIRSFKWFIPPVGGPIIFLVLIAWRFLRKRLDGPINPEFNYYSVGSYALSIAIFVVLLLKILGYLKPNDKPKWVTEKLALLRKRYAETSVDIYRKTFYQSRTITNIIEKATPKIINERYTGYYTIISISFVLLPPLAIALLFFYEVVIAKNFTNFPKYIYVLLCPLIVKIGLWLIREHASIETIAVTSLMELTPNSEENTLNYSIYPFVWEKNPRLAAKVAANIEDILYQYLRRRTALTLIENFESSYLQKTKIYRVISILLWLISWSFMLMYTLQNGGLLPNSYFN